jgi:phosphoglycolate phosphatase
MILVFGLVQGKKIVFVTNNSRKSRRQYSKKFRSLGLEVTEEEIFTSSFAAAMFLKLNNFPPEKKVYVVGEDGILEELKLAGFECFGGPEDGKKNIILEADFHFEHDKSVGAVVVGLDQQFNYYKMQYARTCISENPGCLFIATNRDPTGHMTSAQEWPGAGTMVAAVSCSVQKEPIVVGKPSSFLMDFLLKSFNLETSRMCMVGDRLDTDILFGQSTGCKTLLVLSGCTTLPELQDASNSIHPDVYTNSVYDLVGLLQK